MLPLSDSSSVFLSDSAEFTGAEGSIQPSPVPFDPEMEKTLRLVVVDSVVRLLIEGANADDCLARRKPLTAREASFMAR